VDRTGNLTLGQPRALEDWRAGIRFEGVGLRLSQELGQASLRRPAAWLSAMGVPQISATLARRVEFETTLMIKFLSAMVVLSLSLVLLVGNAGVEAQNSDKPKKTLATFRLTNVDGDEVELDGETLKDQNVIVCFLTTWSELSHRNAKAVAAASKGFDGKLVFVVGGAERLVRDLKAEWNIDGSVWLKASSSVASDFRDCFEPALSLDRVPALVVVDKSRKVHHASVGELTVDEIAEAVKLK
jgi:hypothetical protein